MKVHPQKSCLGDVLRKKTLWKSKTRISMTKAMKSRIIQMIGNHPLRKKRRRRTKRWRNELEARTKMSLCLCLATVKNLLMKRMTKILTLS